MRNSIRFSAFSSIIFLSVTSNAIADPFFGYKVRAGTLIVESMEPDQTFGAQALLLNKKMLTKGDADIMVLGRPVQIGKFDVFVVGETCSGSSCPDQLDSQIYLMEASGKFTIAPMFDIQGKAVQSFYCAWGGHLGDTLPAPKLIGEKWIFQCIERDGRRTRTTYWTLDKGVVRESRTSALWGTVK